MTKKPEQARQYAVQSRSNTEAERRAFVLDRMAENKAYVHALAAAGDDASGKLLESFRERFLWYRDSWRGIPKQAIEQKLFGEAFTAKQFPPLSVDIEVAAVCDLACPFCYRQGIVTPDKLMSEELYYRVIDQCAELGVPSVKLNWRGEPLLHPKLPQFIDYAKRRGILDVMLNTNAVTLDAKKAREIIEAGLDLMIYSFDGGTAETYNKMRVGRFKENTFAQVYPQIRKFAEIRTKLKASFPRTKIQMILTADTFPEIDRFYGLFTDCVDDVSVKAYTERGGSLADLDTEARTAFDAFVAARGLPQDTAHWRDSSGKLFVSVGRLPCEQPYQRLMVTYDGRVSMCCYDWGVEHPVGYIDEAAYVQGDKDYTDVVEKVKKRAKGFELLTQVVMPERHNAPPKKVQTLREIWHGDDINFVRKKQVEGRAGEIAVCGKCPFKETYQWQELPL